MIFYIWVKLTAYPDGNDDGNVEDVVSVVKTKVGLIMIGPEGCCNLGGNNDINTRPDGVEDTHPDSKKQASQNCVTWETVIDSTGPSSMDLYLASAGR